MKKVKLPFNVNTETFSGFYETLEEAEEKYNMWVEFYNLRRGKYGPREIKNNEKQKNIKNLLYTRISRTDEL